MDITGIHSEIGDVKGNVANLELTASSLTTRLENVEGEYSAITQTVSQLQTTVAGKIDETEAQSLITQTVDKISLEVSSGSGGSSFVLKSDGVAISSQNVDLHVNALNVDGEINADSINLSTANISGTLSASYIDVDSITVKNANIESLYASKIIGGALGGYIASGALSDAGHMLSSLYTSSFFANNSIHVMNNGDADSGIIISQGGITQNGTLHLWSDIFSNKSSAVFG